MTKLVNDPSDFPAELVAGFAAAFPHHVREVYGGVVRATRTPKGKVAVLTGGGTGHYPAFMGWVGPGFADGGVTGNIFASPSAAQAVSVAKAAERGGGVIIGFGNYAGDVLHFGDAVERLRADGIDARALVVTDDIASATEDEIDKRRGISGDLPVFKIASAAAEEGMDIDEVERVFRHANDRTRTLGVAFSGCTLPGSSEPLFTVPEGRLGIGLGVHGEPGIDETDLGTADEVATTLVDTVLKERPEGADGRVVVLFNGLGTAKYEEMFVAYRTIESQLEAAGLTVVDRLVGELVTSLDMGGVSLTLVWVDDELERLWKAPCDTPTVKMGQIAGEELSAEEIQQVESAEQAIPDADDAGKAAAARLVEVLSSVSEALAAKKEELGELDTFAGDGDHGTGMARGSSEALASAREAVDAGAGLRTALGRAGETWSDRAGGTSGALWGALLNAAAGELSDTGSPSNADLVRAAKAAVDAVARVGGAVAGDKTMLDALLPAIDALGEGDWAAAAVAAQQGSESTEQMRPKLGRARPLAEKSVGHADPGAVSAALVVRTIARHAGTAH
ncbi:dihydroxyacetone kinase family protein [Georgenia sp. Z1491]|uniref:dihydroxyacetone kinase family protein n=1 Tax=Georgenia sp. Z1491 TaxID=3416707 RepID=UPI003CF8FF9E